MHRISKIGSAPSITNRLRLINKRIVVKIATIDINKYRTDWLKKSAVMNQPVTKKAGNKINNPIRSQP